MTAGWPELETQQGLIVNVRRGTVAGGGLQC
jgi:hypothetical protein